VAVIFQLFVVFDGKYKNNLLLEGAAPPPLPETINSCYIWATAATAAQLVGFITLKA